MFLGIEIGGTKLQFGIGAAEGGKLTALQRADVHPADGAEGILPPDRTDCRSVDC